MPVKIKISKAVIVEGKYDKIKLSSLIDAVIIQTNGFRIFKDKEKCALIRALYEHQGLIILTDSDNAGFQIRRYIKNILGNSLKKGNSDMLIELYIPQISGKESRKMASSKENLLGVEGINSALLRDIFLGQIDIKANTCPKITKQDFYTDGLVGGENSASRRQLLLKKLNLPLYITTNALLDVINSFISREEYSEFVKNL